MSRTAGAGSDTIRRKLSFEASKAAEHIQATEQARAADRARKRSGLITEEKRWRSKSDKLIGPIFSESATRTRARYFLAAFLSCSIFSHFIGFFTFRLFAQQSKSIERMDVDKFYVMFPRWLGWYLSGMVCQALVQYSIWELRMMVQWRTAFYLINALYSSNTFYRLSISTDGARSPEQLMCEEAFTFVEAMVNLSQNYLREIPDLFIKMYLLFEYRTSFLLYAIISMPIMGIIMAWSGKTIWPLTSSMLKTHSDINFVLARIQNNAEQIALFKGGSSERRRWEELLDTFRGCQLRQELIAPVVGLMSTGVLTCVMAPLAWALYNDILDGGVAVAEALNYFRMVGGIQQKIGILGITMGLALYQEVRALAMCNLLEESERYQEQEEQRRQCVEEGKDSYDFILIHEHETPGHSQPELELRDVAVMTPPNIASKPVRTLLDKVTLKLQLGENMLIVGGTGVGKSALLLSIQGLWTTGHGHIHRCSRNAVFCVPQRPYMFRASLRENLMYPEIWRGDAVPDSQLYEALQAVKLATALRPYSLDEEQPWNTILSLGQQQRLAIARGLLTNSVRLLLLDEATSALDMQNERRVYNLLRERVPCYVSVGHRPSVREYHSHVMMLEYNEELNGPDTQHTFKRLNQSTLQALPRVKDLPSGPGILEQVATAKVDNKVPDFWSITAGGGVGMQNELVPSIEDRGNVGSDTASSGLKFVGPNMKRRMGGIHLVKRAACDVVWPLCKERHFWMPVSLSLGMLVFSTSVLGVWMAELMNPVMAFQDILRLRNRDLAWSYLMRIAWQLPCISLLGYFSTVGSLLLTTTLFIEAKRGLARRYLDGRCDTYYHLHMSRLLMNPGTRIANWDTQTAIRWLAELVSTLTLSTGLMGVMWRLSHQAFGKLFIAYLYVGAIILFLFFHTLFANYNGWLTEIMHLHANIIHTRENAEAVALLDGSESERIRSYEVIDRSITPGSKYVWQKSFFGFMSGMWYNDFLDLWLMCMYNPMVLQGTIALGESETSKNLFRYASGFASSICRDCIGRVEGQLGMERLWELMVAMSEISSATSKDLRKKWGGDISLVDTEMTDVVLEFKDMILKTPLQVKTPSRTLLTAVSMRVMLGETLLIAGESGIGKSSVVRAIAGLWRNGSGTITRPPWRYAFFIAQRPYMCIGTLREQLLYPRVGRRDISDERLEDIIRMVELDHLLQAPGLGVMAEDVDVPSEDTDRFVEFGTEDTDQDGGYLPGRMWRKAKKAIAEEIPDRSTLHKVKRSVKNFIRYDPERQQDMNWCNSLSLGEIQRISFARLLLQEDLRLVILDEATSGLSPEGEESIYNLMQQHTKSYVSVAHRPQLRRFHKRALVLEAAENEGTGEPGPATYRDLPMPAYEAELAAQEERRPVAEQPDE
mmetsp:Transcript_51929/g.166243  ORF Transcript_51929/g.166243 Transcript_51929/m.166243 type:complete len:1394 (-) Transcript_51929:76-4257(-)